MSAVWLLVQDRDYQGAWKVLRVFTSEAAALNDLALLKAADTPGQLEVHRHEVSA